jgi:predicted heme/steroid binding protein
VEGSLDLNPTGQAFRQQGYRWPLAGTADSRTPFRRALETVLRFLHIVAAFSWLGAIFFIHIIIKPKTVEHGIPTAAFRLTWINIIILSVTGIILMFMRLGSIHNLVDTRFGRLLGLKILLFLVLVAAAAFVTLRLNRKLRGASSGGSLALPSEEMMRKFTPEELASYDGKEGRPTYMSHGGIVYDVSGSKLWRLGKHAGRHEAGADLTEDLPFAPHGVQVFERVTRVGVLTSVNEEGHGVNKEHHQRAVKMLHFLANFNLIVALSILFILALWRV